MDNNKRKEIFNAWANPVGNWAGWVKPVLFAHLLDAYSEGEAETLKSMLQKTDVSWAPKKDENIAIVVDLPGSRSLLLGLALALKGYQPVPLYNGAPDSRGIVDMQAIMSLLVTGHQLLEGIEPPINAPPVFLLDSHRMMGVSQAGKYDNRWIVLPQDFPSGNMLLKYNIKTVILVQDDNNQPANDLRHVLKRWQNSGIAILASAFEQPGNLVPIQITTPSNFQSLIYRALVLIGLRRNSAGGFGALVPEPSSGGGFS
jgi:hypothetical protein